MLVNRILFVICTVIIMVTLLMIQLNPIIAGIITIIIVIIGYIAIGYRRNKKRVFLLDEACDPEAFLEKINKQEKITGKNAKIATYLAVDKAAALIALGRFQEAKEMLETINESNLSEKNNSLLVYTINWIGYYYAIGDIAQAEHLFETRLPILAPISPKVKSAINIIIGYRFYIKGKYDESREQLSKFLDSKLSRRERLGILFILAQIEETEKNLVKAKEKYIQVAEQGNKLLIAEQARKRLIALA